MVQGQISEADTPTILLGTTPSGLISNPPPLSPHFCAGCHSCGNPPKLSWLGTGTTYTGLHTQWLGYLKGAIFYWSIGRVIVSCCYSVSPQIDCWSLPVTHYHHAPLLSSSSSPLSKVFGVSVWTGVCEFHEQILAALCLVGCLCEMLPWLQGAV